MALDAFVRERRGPRFLVVVAQRHGTNLARNYCESRSGGEQQRGRRASVGRGGVSNPLVLYSVSRRAAGTPVVLGTHKLVTWVTCHRKTTEPSPRELEVQFLVRNACARSSNTCVTMDCTSQPCESDTIRFR
jgi:hypothetical protein